MALIDLLGCGWTHVRRAREIWIGAQEPGQARPGSVHRSLAWPGLADRCTAPGRIFAIGSNCELGHNVTTSTLLNPNAIT